MHCLNYARSVEQEMCVQDSFERPLNTCRKAGVVGSEEVLSKGTFLCVQLTLESTDFVLVDDVSSGYSITYIQV